MSVEIEIYQHAIDELEENAFEQVIDAADYLANRIRRNISHPGPPHSTPGEFPHMVSGALEASIHVYPDRKNKTVQIVAEAEHAGYVEKMRPFMQRTYEEEQHNIAAIAVGR